MQTTDTLSTLFRHNLWANIRLIEKCKQLTPEQLEATLAGTYGSIHDTLLHIVRAERSYHSRITTGKRYDLPDSDAPMTLDEMIDTVRKSGSGLIEWVSRVQPGDTVKVDWDGTPVDVPKAVIFTQAINHSTEHRAQVMVMLTQLGIEPPDLDGWTYFDET